MSNQTKIDPLSEQAQTSLKEFVRTLARMAAQRDWANAIATQSARSEPNEPNQEIHQDANNSDRETRQR